MTQQKAAPALTVTLASLLIFAGCSTQIGGDGQLSNGEPLSVLLNVDMNAVDAVQTIDIASPDGWSCRSVLKDNSGPSQSGPRLEYPMICSDGATGTILVTWDSIQQRQHGAFRLSDGRSGKVTFDYKR